MNCDAVSQLKKMAMEPFSRRVLARDDGLLGGLIMVLSNEDSHVVNESLETLILLSEHESKSHLKNFLGMQDQLKLLKESNKCMKTKELALRLENTLLNSSKDKHGLKERQGGNNIKSTPTGYKTHQHKKKVFLRTQGSSKTVILQIKGLEDKRDMDVARNHLLKVKGVISITFDMNKKRSIVRVKNDLKVEMLAFAISEGGLMSAEQVIKSTEGQETLVTFGAGPANTSKENLDMPSYLPDEDSPVKDGAIARVGAEHNDGGGWLKSAASFLTNSFYW